MLVVAVVGFEGRVVFHAFGQYVRLPPPWNWVAVSAALMGGAGLIIAAHAGAVGRRMDVTVAGTAPWLWRDWVYMSTILIFRVLRVPDHLPLGHGGRLPFIQPRFIEF